MTRIRRTAPARSQGVRRWVFAHGVAPDVEDPVREWLTARLDGFHCDLQVMYLPHAVGPTLAGTHIVLNNAPPLHSMARTDEAVEVDARGMTPGGVVEALLKATGLDPRLSVRGWPCADGVDDAKGRADPSQAASEPCDPGCGTANAVRTAPRMRKAEDGRSEG